MTGRRRPGPGAVLKALDVAVKPYPTADPLLLVLLRQVADDIDAAETTSQRATSVRLLLDIADRLDLVPLPPGRGNAAASAPAPPGPDPAGGDSDRDPFDLPELPAGVGHPT